MGEKKPNVRFISTSIEPEFSTPATPAQVGFMLIHPGEQPPELMPGNYTFFTLIHILKGGGSMQLNGKTYKLKAGQLYFSLPGQVIHHLQFVDTKAVLIFAPAGFLLKCEPDLMKMRFLQYAADSQHVSLSPIQSREILRFETHILHEINANLPLKQATMENMFRLQLLSLERFYRLAHDFSEEDNMLLREFYAMLNMTHDYSISLVEFSEILKTTPSQLNAVVRKHTGKSARQHIHEKMVRISKTYLRYTKLNIEEISYLLGFHFPQYFDRVFKKESGITPTSYRKNLKTSA